MKKRISVFGLSAAAILISGCATTADPAKVCTADWIKPRAAEAVGYLERDTSSVFKNVRKVAENYADGKTPGPFEMLALSRSLKKFEKQLTNGRAVKDLRMLSKTCDDPKIVTKAVSGFLSDKGLPPQILYFVENLDSYKALFQEAMKRPAG